MLRALQLLLVVCSIAIVGLASHRQASASDSVAPWAPRLGDESVVYVRIGMVITAEGGACRGIEGTTPVPIEWPEQQVEIIDEDVSAHVDRVSYRMVGGTVQQMLVRVPFLAAGDEARTVVTFEVRRRAVVEPETTAELIVPASRDLENLVRLYLRPSKGIESTNRRIKQQAREVSEGQQTAWQKVEAIYDWVRDNVEYVDGPFKGALRALRDGDGDCEELSSLFIAMCRAEGIPARTVWVPGHCYPEFYLHDAEGNGFWFPCQAAGSREFGAMQETRPILQKGDNFRDPDRPREAQRYVSEFLTGAGGKPKVRFIREVVNEP